MLGLINDWVGGMNGTCVSVGSVARDRFFRDVRGDRDGC